MCVCVCVCSDPEGDSEDACQSDCASFFWDPLPATSSASEGGAGAGAEAGEGASGGVASSDGGGGVITGASLVPCRAFTPPADHDPQQQQKQQQHFSSTPTSGLVTEETSLEGAETTSSCAKKGIAFYESPAFKGSASFDKSPPALLRESVDLVTEEEEEEEELVPRTHVSSKNRNIPTVAESPRVSCVNEAINVQMKQKQINNRSGDATAVTETVTPQHSPVLTSAVADEKSSPNMKEIYIDNVEITPDRKRNHHLTLKRKSSGDPHIEPEPVPVPQSVAGAEDGTARASKRRRPAIPPPSKRPRPASSEGGESASSSSGQSVAPRRTSRGTSSRGILPPTQTQTQTQTQQETPTPTAATTPSGRPSRRAVSSPQAHRDAIFGSWPSRTQAASQGTWKL
jgi:hypothetical protein